ncbi:MAG: rRNA pseudouridine synthase [Ruminococcaceae bacterium]|nr:rRNA pseudouridine synthase [Oscillospiraceae bacterium]
MEKIRLQKFISDCGIMSRRAAEKAIEAGEVLVNGEVATLGTKVDPRRDKVLCQGAPVGKKQNFHYTYIMLNKPTGYVTTLSDEKGRKTVAELVEDTGVRVYPVGRLDMNSEGLLLMTNDGALTNALTHPRHLIPKLYNVKVSGNVTRAKVAELASLTQIDGEKIMPVQCGILRHNEKTSVLEMILYEGKNRQIRRMCEAVDLEVKALKRVALGDLVLDVKKGEWRYLNVDEVKALKKAVGLL